MASQALPICMAASELCPSGGPHGRDGTAMAQPWHMAFSRQEPSVGITNWSNNCYLSAVRDLAFSTMELTSDALVFDGKFMGISTLSHLESDDFCSPVQLRGRMRTKPSQTSLPNQIKNMSQNSHNRGHNGQMVKLW